MTLNKLIHCSKFHAESIYAWTLIILKEKQEHHAKQTKKERS